MRHLIALIIAALAGMLAPLRWVLKLGRWVLEPSRPATIREPAADLADELLAQGPSPLRLAREEALAAKPEIGHSLWIWAVRSLRLPEGHDGPLPPASLPRNVLAWAAGLSREQKRAMTRVLPVAVQEHVDYVRGIPGLIPGVPRCPSLEEHDAAIELAKVRAGQGGAGGKGHRGTKAMDQIREPAGEVAMVSADEFRAQMAEAFGLATAPAGPRRR